MKILVRAGLLSTFAACTMAVSPAASAGPPGMPTLPGMPAGAGSLRPPRLQVMVKAQVKVRVTTPGGVIALYNTRVSTENVNYTLKANEDREIYPEFVGFPAPKWYPFFFDFSSLSNANPSSNLTIDFTISSVAMQGLVPKVTTRKFTFTRTTVVKKNAATGGETASTSLSLKEHGGKGVVMNSFTGSFSGDLVVP